jgi:hypothetical protein
MAGCDAGRRGRLKEVLLMALIPSLSAFGDSEQGVQLRFRVQNTVRNTCNPEFGEGAQGTSEQASERDKSLVEQRLSSSC